ncbi:MAG: hypothetical protein ACKO96_29080, partial [Flammeovirgaceae bacterium]
GKSTSRANGTYMVPVQTGNVIFLDCNFIGLPKTLHHELSSVLFWQIYDDDPTFREKFEGVADYFDSVTTHVVDNPDWKKGDTSFPKNTDNTLVLRNDGYALTDFENDYNSIERMDDLIHFVIKTKKMPTMDTLLLLARKYRIVFQQKLIVTVGGHLRNTKL